MSGSQDGHLALNQMKKDDINLYHIPGDRMVLDLFSLMSQAVINSKFSIDMSYKRAPSYWLFLAAFEHRFSNYLYKR